MLISFVVVSVTVTDSVPVLSWASTVVVSVFSFFLLNKPLILSTRSGTRFTTLSVESGLETMCSSRTSPLDTTRKAIGQ